MYAKNLFACMVLFLAMGCNRASQESVDKLKEKNELLESRLEKVEAGQVSQKEILTLLVASSRETNRLLGVKASPLDSLPPSPPASSPPSPSAPTPPPPLVLAPSLPVENLVDVIQRKKMELNQEDERVKRDLREALERARIDQKRIDQEKLELWQAGKKIWDSTKDLVPLPIPPSLIPITAPPSPRVPSGVTREDIHDRAWLAGQISELSSGIEECERLIVGALNGDQARAQQRRKEQLEAKKCRLQQLARK